MYYKTKQKIWFFKIQVVLWPFLFSLFFSPEKEKKKMPMEEFIIAMLMYYTLFLLLHKVHNQPKNN